MLTDSLSRGRRAALLLTPTLALAMAPIAGCKRPGAVAEALLPEATNPLTSGGQAQCKVRASQQRPLIVEWPSADRAALESQTRKGLVVVAYHGCQMEVLRQCLVRGRYRFAPVTPKEDKVRMESADELYMNIPVYAAKFEGKLGRGIALKVDMTIVGMFEADRAMVQVDELVGNCKGATHVVTALAAGAYEFYSVAKADIGVGGKVPGIVEAGVEQEAKKESFTSDGDKAACVAADLTAVAPPVRCGALLRLEVAELTVPEGMEPTPAIVALREPPPAPGVEPPKSAPTNVPRPEPTRKDVVQPKGRRLLIAGGVLGGLGVGALAGMGAALGLGAKSEEDFMTSAPADRGDVDDRGKSMNKLAIGLGVTGGVLAAAGVALVVVGLAKRKSLAFTPRVGPHQAGLGMSLSF